MQEFSNVLALQARFPNFFQNCEADPPDIGNELLKAETQFLIRIEV